MQQKISQGIDCELKCNMTIYSGTKKYATPRSHVEDMQEDMKEQKYAVQGY
jgi:hypothetical protein